MRYKKKFRYLFLNKSHYQNLIRRITNLSSQFNYCRMIAIESGEDSLEFKSYIDETEKLYSEMMSLPCDPSHKIDEIKRVAFEIKNFFKNYANKKL